MKILFLEKKLRTDKLGILYLSRVLKDAGHEVDLIQTDLEDISSINADFIMYSVMSGEHEWFLEMNRELKKKHKFKAVMGGPHFTFFPEQGLNDPDVDFVVQGAGEGVIVEIVEGRVDKKLIRGFIPDVNNLPNPDRSILYKYSEFGDARMKRFIAGRYCLYSCTYCFNHLFKKLYVDQKDRFFQRVSPRKIIEEIKEVKKEYGLELAYFNDDDLAADKDWLIEFCGLFKKEIGIEFCGSIRASSVDDDLLKLMANSGCVFLNVALESAVPETQKLLRRGFITNDQIKQACKSCEKYGIKVRLQNMIGLPVDDSLEDALETLRMNQEINPTDSWAAIFQPFPRTDLWKYCIDKGLITEETQSRAFYEHTPLNLEDADKINRLHKWWFFAIRYQFPIELIRILLDTPLDDKQEKRMQDYRWEVAKGLLYGL
jgi:anaerobic magnesium-protoporphyrin IX monomethyl ester cyclase